MTTDSAEGSDAGAEGATTPDAARGPYSLWLFDRLKESRSNETGEFPLAAVFIRFAIAAPFLLVGLPLVALAIVQFSGCCTSQSTAGFLTFWGSLFAGMLALFGVLIAAVFVISAFRIDKSAKAEAQMAAEDAVAKFIVKYKEELLGRVDTWLSEVELAKKVAIESIDTAKIAAESKSETAVTEIEKAQSDVEQRAKQTTDAMGKAARDVEKAKTDAVEQMESAATEVERVSAEIKARLESQRPDESPPDDSQG